MRLLISALLAVLVHAYWLFSDTGAGDGSSPGKAPESVVISLAAVVQPSAPDRRGESGTDAEPATQRRQTVAFATQPSIKESKDGPTDREGPVDEEDAMRSGKGSETKSNDQGMAAEAPFVEKADAPVARRRPVVQSTPKTEARKLETRRTPRKDRARNALQRSQTAQARSRVAKSKQVERRTALATSVEPQTGRYEQGDGVPDAPAKVLPDGGDALNPETSVTQVLKEARPLYKRNPRPPYPRVARRRGYEGTVIVRALVNVDGLVNEVRLDESSGYETLDGAALQTVQRWAFEPAVRGTETVEMWVRIPLRFNLD